MIEKYLMVPSLFKDAHNEILSSIKEGVEKLFAKYRREAFRFFADGVEETRHVIGLKISPWHLIRIFKRFGTDCSYGRITESPRLCSEVPSESSIWATSLMDLLVLNVQLCGQPWNTCLFEERKQFASIVSRIRSTPVEGHENYCIQPGSR